MTYFHVLPLQGWRGSASFPHPCRGTAAHFLAFTLQFNLTQVCLAMASSLCWALGTLRHRGSGSAFKNSQCSRETHTTGLHFCQVPSLGRVCTWIPVLRCEGSQRERLSLAPAKRQRAHLCVCLGEDKVICLGPLWPSLPHPCHHSHLLFPHFESGTQAFPFSNTPAPDLPSTRKKSLWGANYNEQKFIPANVLNSLHPKDWP